MIPALLYGYLLGTLPIAPLFGLLRRKNLFGKSDLEALRALGPLPAAMAGVLELTKGLLALVLGEAFAGAPGALVAGAAAVFGHAYPFFAPGRGGSGHLPALGALFGAHPALALSALVGFLLKREALAALAAAATGLLLGRADLALFALAVHLPPLIKSR